MHLSKVTFQAIRSLNLHQVGSSQSCLSDDGDVVPLSEFAVEARQALVAATREISTRSLLHETLSSPPRLLLKPRPVTHRPIMGSPARSQAAKCAYPMILATESDEVVKRLETWKEEIGAAFYGRESWQALYLSPDWPLRNSYGPGPPGWSFSATYFHPR